MNGASILTITRGDGSVEHRHLATGSYLVGRESGDIVLNDHSVSFNHARLDVNATGVKLTDLGSSNGTFDAQGVRLWQTYDMSPGTPVFMGNCTLCVQPPASSGATVLVPSGSPVAGITRQPHAVPNPVVHRVAHPPIPSQPVPTVQTSPGRPTPMPPVPLQKGPSTALNHREPAALSSMAVMSRVQLLFGSVLLTAYRGTVLEQRVDVSTEMSISGGGGHISTSVTGHVYGHINPVQSHTTTTTHSELFLRLDDGREVLLRSSVPFRQSSPLRAGHRVTMIWASTKNNSQGVLASAYVHSMGQRYDILSAGFIRNRFSYPLNLLGIFSIGIGMLVLLPFSFLTLMAWLIVVAVLTVRDTSKVQQALIAARCRLEI